MALLVAKPCQRLRHPLQSFFLLTGHEHLQCRVGQCYRVSGNIGREGVPRFVHQDERLCIQTIDDTRIELQMRHATSDEQFYGRPRGLCS